jgi:hypothetical protein
LGDAVVGGWVGEVGGGVEPVASQRT